MQDADFKQALQRFNEIELKMQTFTDMVKSCNQRQARIKKSIEAIEGKLIEIEHTANYGYRYGEVAKTEVEALKTDIAEIKETMLRNEVI